ncbi:hypothetical protein ACS8YF_14855, partial [Salinisphaera sp. SWV1]|uniref:hypothetical protein n=1 Tax=Salinisphaera sp. SWV1 TaxID=3454139 RepID=UPI003F8547A6
DQGPNPNLRQTTLGTSFGFYFSSALGDTSPGAADHEIAAIPHEVAGPPSRASPARMAGSDGRFPASRGLTAD